MINKIFDILIIAVLMINSVGCIITGISGDAGTHSVLYAGVAMLLIMEAGKLAKK